jgi:hypothetical protein
MADVQFYIGNRRVSATVATDDDLSQATFVTFTSTTQKNYVRNEAVGLGRSGNPFVRPVASAVQRVRHLHDNLAQPTAPLCA